MGSDVKPPVFVSGGKRLNFSRESDWHENGLMEDFEGFGKDEGCRPSASWGELCALAKLITEHPAYAPSVPDPSYYPPRVEDDEYEPAPHIHEGARDTL